MKVLVWLMYTQLVYLLCECVAAGVDASRISHDKCAEMWSWINSVKTLQQGKLATTAAFDVDYVTGNFNFHSMWKTQKLNL